LKVSNGFGAFKALFRLSNFGSGIRRNIQGGIL